MGGDNGTGGDNGETMGRFSCLPVPLCSINNIYNLSIYEKYAILMTHTANVNFNSFAAEVQYHAYALDSALILFDKAYEAAIRADMIIGEEDESGFFDEYYDLDSEIVMAQANYHGAY